MATISKAEQTLKVESHAMMLDTAFDGPPNLRDFSSLHFPNRQLTAANTTMNKRTTNIMNAFKREQSSSNNKARLMSAKISKNLF